MHIGWPQGILIGWVVPTLVIAAGLDGDPKTGQHKFSLEFVTQLLLVGLLYWGGFFS